MSTEALDRTLITDLLARYSWALADRDWPTWTGVFTDDAQVDYSTAGGPVGTPQQAAETFAVIDPWEEIVRAAILADAEPITARRILVDVLKIEPGRIRKPDEMRLGNVLRRLGYERQVVRSPDGTQRVWVPVQDAAAVTS